MVKNELIARSKALSENQTDAQLFKNISAFYGVRMLITFFKRASHES
jgi:hypothetical protein